MASTPSGGASNRLLNMKFMQRAAAAASPAPSGVSQSEDERPSKRVKTESRSSTGTPQGKSPLFDEKAAQAAQAAILAEERKREALIERQAEKLGDAYWKFDPAKLPKSNQQRGVPLKIVHIGFSEIDQRNALDAAQPEMDGPSFQSYRPKEPKKTKDEVRATIHIGNTIS